MEVKGRSIGTVGTYTEYKVVAATLRYCEKRSYDYERKEEEEEPDPSAIQSTYTAVGGPSFLPSQ